MQVEKIADMTRFDINTTFVVGIALPLLETLRRRTDFSEFLFYIDDYIAGGLLLLAAHATSRGWRVGPVLMVLAWGVVCGGLYGSFFGQLTNLSVEDPSGLPSAAVVFIKGMFFALGIFMMFRTVKRCAALSS